MTAVYNSTLEPLKPLLEVAIWTFFAGFALETSSFQKLNFPGPRNCNQKKCWKYKALVDFPVNEKWPF